MNALTRHDLQFALLRTPRPLLRLMKKDGWVGRIFVGGGFLRSVVCGDPINDVDVFVQSKADAWAVARALVIDAKRIKPLSVIEPFTPEQEATIKRHIYETDNALTVTCCTPAIQVIHRWVFPTLQAVADSFDFTCCCAAFGWMLPSDLTATSTPAWESYCDERFYPDVASKRLVYRNPVRNEDAGGSMLRVLKYYQKGYRIPLDSLADVITRLVHGVDLSKCMTRELNADSKFVDRVEQKQFSKVICGLLREVDPNVDPNHLAHLPAEKEEIQDE
jgi:hypothetical protein